MVASPQWHFKSLHDCLVVTTYSVLATERSKFSALLLASVYSFLFYVCLYIHIHRYTYVYGGEREHTKHAHIIRILEEFSQSEHTV